MESIYSLSSSFLSSGSGDRSPFFSTDFERLRELRASLLALLERLLSLKFTNCIVSIALLVKSHIPRMLEELQKLESKKLPRLGSTAGSRLRSGPGILLFTGGPRLFS